MADIKTTYMGMELKNPLIAASSGLSRNLKGVKTLADSGIGAIVLKSLFEEQIDAEAGDTSTYAGPLWHTEAYDYVSKLGMEIGSESYLQLIESAKESVDIPVIASLNCVSEHWWTDYAKKIEHAGADGLELNISPLSADPEKTSAEIETAVLKTVAAVTSSVSIPVAVKLGPWFTALPHLASQLARQKAAALVLFNRFYKIDLDLEKMQFIAANRFSSPDEFSQSLRWIAMLAGRTDCDLAASTGIHDGKTAVKMLLAGARVVQLGSVLYQQTPGAVRQILTEIENWMTDNHYQTLVDFRGKMSHARTKHPEAIERLQYIKALVGIQ